MVKKNLGTLNLLVDLADPENDGAFREASIPVVWVFSADKFIFAPNRGISPHWTADNLPFENSVLDFGQNLELMKTEFGKAIERVVLREKLCPDTAEPMSDFTVQLTAPELDLLRSFVKKSWGDSWLATDESQEPIFNSMYKKLCTALKPAKVS